MWVQVKPPLKVTPAALWCAARAVPRTAIRLCRDNARQTVCLPDWTQRPQRRTVLWGGWRYDPAPYWHEPISKKKNNTQISSCFSSPDQVSSGFLHLFQQASRYSKFDISLFSTPVKIISMSADAITTALWRQKASWSINSHWKVDMCNLIITI